MHWTQHREQLRIFSSPVVLPHFFFFFAFFFVYNISSKIAGIEESAGCEALFTACY